MMDRYLVFTFNHYYPSGGMGDITFTSDSKEEVEKLLSQWEDGHNIHAEIQILNTKLGEIVYVGNRLEEGVSEKGSWVNKPIKKEEWEWL